jgi:cell division protein FtsB
VNNTLGSVIGGVLTLVLGGGAIKGVLDYLAVRQQIKVDYGQAVTKTLADFNDRLKTEVHDLREENAQLRRTVRELENRVASLERDLPK